MGRTNVAACTQRRSEHLDPNMRGHQLLCFRGGKRSLFMQRLVPFVYAYIWRVLRLLYRTLAKLARSDATFNALCGKSEWLFGLQRGLILSLQNTTVSQKRNKNKIVSSFLCYPKSTCFNCRRWLAAGSICRSRSFPRLTEVF